MSEWKPIDTAPKDGTKVLIWNSVYDFCPIAWWGEKDGDDSIFYGWNFEGGHSPCCSCEDDFIGWNEDIDEGFMPTHWMPLPEPPAR